LYDNTEQFVYLPIKKIRGKKHREKNKDGKRMGEPVQQQKKQRKAGMNAAPDCIS
jgi:hypothetical protein